MNIRHLTAAVLLGLGSVSTPLLISQAQAADMEMQAQAEQVKARIANLDKITTQTYQRFFSQSPVLQSITVETGDYQATDTGLNAVSKVTITRNPAYLEESDNPDIVLEMKDNILFNDELSNQGILARVEGEVIPNEDLKNLLDVQDNQDAENLNKALEYLAITSDLYNDGRINQLVQIKPFELNEDGETIQFDGLNLTSQSNESSLADGAGKVELAFGKLTITSAPSGEAAQSEEQPVSSIVTFHPVKANYELTEGGDMTLNTSPIKIENSEDNMLITIDGVKGKGDDIHFDDELGTFIGEQEFVFDNIQIKDDTMPSPIIIDSIRYDTDAEKDGDLYDFGGGINIDVNGESIRNLTGMTGLEIEDIEIKASFENLSADTFKLINYELPVITETQDQARLQHNMQNLISDMASNQAKLDIDVAFNTDQGDATFVADIKAKDDAVTDVQQWQAAMDSQQPTAMINLLQQSFDFDIKLTVPESLIQATGMEGMMAMTTGYVVKEGSDYVLHIENTDDGIELNGNVMPLPQQ